MSMKGSLPRRYARALVEIGKEEGVLEKFAEQLEALVSLSRLKDSHFSVLANDLFDLSGRVTAAGEIADHMGLHPLFKNFFILLVKKERAGFLEDIYREYRQFYDEILGIVRVAVRTPFLPGPSILQRVESLLAKKLQKKVVAHGEADPELIGGIVIETEKDHTVYDGSIKRELERMRETISKS